MKTTLRYKFISNTSKRVLHVLNQQEDRSLMFVTHGPKIMNYFFNHDE